VPSEVDADADDEDDDAEVVVLLFPLPPTALDGAVLLPPRGMEFKRI